MLLAAIMAMLTVVAVAPSEKAQASYVDEFLATVGPMCTNDMRDNKILASFTLAQAIYESGWGRSTLAVEANNLFGMRAYSTWTGKVYDRNEGVLYQSWQSLVSTKGNTYVNNYSMSFWRAFDNWQESVNSHSELFNTSSRYKNLRGNYNYKSCCTLVVEDGYCTDSGYSSSLINLIERYDLEQYNYVFTGDEGEVGGNDPVELPYSAENLFSGLTVDYYLKGTWNEYSGTTKLPTDGKFRGDGTNNWNGNSALSGVTFDTADYNGTSATTNYLVFNMAEAVDIYAVNILGYREDGNRNYASLEVFAGTEALTVNADNCETITQELTEIEYTLEKKILIDAPTSGNANQYFDLTLTLTGASEIKSILIKTNKDRSSSGFFQFDEISAHGPIAKDPFTFAEGTSTDGISLDTQGGYLTLGTEFITADSLMALFVDREMNVKTPNGSNAAVGARVSTGWVLNTVINGITSSVTVVVPCDINCDADISSADYISMVSALKKATTLNQASRLAADADGDGSVSSTDLILLKNMLG